MGRGRILGGTPHVTSPGLDKQSVSFTFCLRSDRYDTNHSRAIPLMPYQVDRRLVHKSIFRFYLCCSGGIVGVIWTFG